MIRFSLCAAAVLIAASPSALAQSDTAGAAAFATCRGCHTLQKGGRNGLGPNLSGLFGRKAGSVPGFAYSPALKAAPIRWDAKTLDAYLAAPTKAVPGSRMPIAVPDAARRAAIIAYLKVETAG